MEDQSDGTKKLLEHWFRTPNMAGQKYDTMQLEVLGLVWSILFLRSYFEEHVFKVRTDQNSINRFSISLI